MSEELRTFGANFTSGGARFQYAAAGVAEHSRSGAAGLVHGASPWLYGMARTELEKW